MGERVDCYAAMRHRRRSGRATAATHRPYSRTPHLPWSPGASPDDVRVTGLTDLARREAVVTEGYVLRAVEGFGRAEFGERVAKWVRPGHVTTSRHWMPERVEPDGLGPDAVLWDVRSGGVPDAGRLCGVLGGPAVGDAQEVAGRAAARLDLLGRGRSPGWGRRPAASGGVAHVTGSRRVGCAGRDADLDAVLAVPGAADPAAVREAVAEGRRGAVHSGPRRDAGRSAFLVTAFGESGAHRVEAPGADAGGATAGSAARRGGRRVCHRRPRAPSGGTGRGRRGPGERALTAPVPPGGPRRGARPIRVPPGRGGAGGGRR